MARVKSRGTPWSLAEIAALKRLYPQAPREEILDALPGRTWCAVLHEASALMIPRLKYMHAVARPRGTHPLLQQLRTIREQRRLSRAQLAPKVGYHEGQILQWENGKTRPAFQSVADWAGALGFDLVLQPQGAARKTVGELVVPFPTRAQLMAGR